MSSLSTTCALLSCLMASLMVEMLSRGGGGGAVLFAEKFSGSRNLCRCTGTTLSSCCSELSDSAEVLVLTPPLDAVLKLAMCSCSHRKVTMKMKMAVRTQDEPWRPRGRPKAPCIATPCKNKHLHVSTKYANSFSRIFNFM